MHPERFTSADVAAWLLEALESAGSLDREFHVQQVAAWFGAEFRVLDADGCATFAAEVLESVKGIAGDRRIVWDPKLLAWR